MLLQPTYKLFPLRLTFLQELLTAKSSTVHKGIFIFATFSSEGQMVCQYFSDMTQMLTALENSGYSTFPCGRAQWEQIRLSRGSRPIENTEGHPTVEKA